MEVLHIPSGGVEINGVAYLAAGPGAHRTLVFVHGLPGNEKNLDLAQSDDGLAADNDALVKQLRLAGNSRISALRATTDLLVRRASYPRGRRVTLARAVRQTAQASRKRDQP